MYFIPPFYTISYVYHLRPYSFTFYVESVLRFREVYSFFGQFLPKKRWHRFFEKRGTDGIRRNRKNGTLKCTVLGTVFFMDGKGISSKISKKYKKGNPYRFFVQFILLMGPDLVSQYILPFCYSHLF